MDLQELNNRLEEQITQLRATHLALHNMIVDVRIRNGLLLVSGYMGGLTSPHTRELSGTLSRLQQVMQQVHFRSIALNTEVNCTVDVGGRQKRA